MIAKRIYFLVLTIIAAAPVNLAFAQNLITTGTLLREMTDMERLTQISKEAYKVVQFSSYDRRSVSSDKPHWFSNYDGFGGEPIPGFINVLKQPGIDGIGEYLICDIKQPGVVQRLWTADMTGEIRLFLDGKQVYSGPANNFLWNFPLEVAKVNDIEIKGSLRQFDALYFPIAFAKSCRMEWRGDLKTRHFYHVGIRLYDKNVKIKTFQPEDLRTYRADMDQAIKTMTDPQRLTAFSGEKRQDNSTISKWNKREIFRITGSKAIEMLKIKVHTSTPEIILRQTILRVYFDGSSIPQIESPVGDFFGAAPGVNPFNSLPFSVDADSSMTCRFLMPFRDSVSVQIENISDYPVSISAELSSRPYAWDNNRSMYFRARWRINHGLISSNAGLETLNEGLEACDVPYLLAMGEGRVVGAACYLMNPTSVPTSNGNWWGEGDEKIYVDNDSFPSFFGTGTEDYFNYSWSSDNIFFYPYCGQPRNDGPSNRGFISNFRWHISDDISFNSRIAFYMEQLSHDYVPGFIYARMVYLYGREGMRDDHYTISRDDVRPMMLPEWNPATYRASAFYRFINAENAYKGMADNSLEYDPLWAGGKIFIWKPRSQGEKISFEINTSPGEKNMIISLGHMPGGGKIRMYINDKPVQLKKNNTLDLDNKSRVLNRAYTTGNIEFLDGRNMITLENLSEGGVKIGIDQLWIRD